MKSLQRNTLSLFEVIVPKWLPYWLYWPFLALLFFIGSEIVIRYFAEKYLLITRLIFAACISFFPMMVIILSHTFRSTMKGLSNLVWNDDTDFDSWCSENEWRIFSLKTKRTKLINTTVIIVGVATILAVGLPFQNMIANLMGLVGFVEVLAICGCGGSVLIELLLTLVDLTQKDVHVPFFLLPHPAFMRLQNYYSLLAIFVTSSYILLVVAVWQGPYGLTFGMLVWLAILSFYPLSTFIWSTFQIHKLMQKAKQDHIEIANSRVLDTLQKIIERDENKDYERLEKAMSIQSQVQKLSEWPIAVSGTITFLVTITTATVQTIVAIVNALKP